jgi:hypothetical protein
MVNKAQDLLDKFVDSIGDLLNDITALEVNTMIVAEITGAKFNAWEAYQEIYSIDDPSYFKEAHIPNSLHKRYYNLFDKLEREYFYILIGSSPELKNLNDERVIRYDTRMKWVKQNKKRIVKSDPDYVNELGDPILPDPTIMANWPEIQRFLENNQFLRSLRKIIELKGALDSSDSTSESIDIVYAQTVMQLDGDIINRYHTKLFEDEEIKALVLKTHNEAVVAGEEQWRGLLDFMVNLVRSTTSRGLLNRFK